MKKLIFAFICLLLAVSCQAGTITTDNEGPADFNNSLEWLTVRTGRTINFNIFERQGK